MHVPTSKQNPQRYKIAIRNFIESPVTSSILLIVATIVALIWANSPFSHSYFHLWETEFSITFGEHIFAMSLHQWINDGLMVLFFLSVGLEIKREVRFGKLSTMKAAMLPIIAALGGMVVPAVLYSLINMGGEGASGWGVPMATDIAFAIGVMMLLGKRVPISLKIFITALAIIDDIGAVLVIAVFYSTSIVWWGLQMAAVFLFLIYIGTRLNIRYTGLYMVLTAGVWLGMIFSGVHATLAGILAAMMVPATSPMTAGNFVRIERGYLRRLSNAHVDDKSLLTDHEQIEAIHGISRTVQEIEPVLVWLEHALLPYVNILVIPLFALSNAGIHLGGHSGNIVTNPITIGVVVGLIVGKQLGVTLFTWLGVKLNLADLPEGVTWLQVYAMSWLTSIGFTMSLFITELAFHDEDMIASAKVGILLASVMAGVIGYIILRATLRLPEPPSLTPNEKKAAASA